MQKQNSAEEYITFLRLFSESTNITFTTIVHNNKFGYVYNLTTLCVEGASESEATCTCAHRCVGVRSPVQVHMLGQRPQYGVQSYGKYSRVRCFCLYFARAPIHIGSCAYLTRFEWKAGGQYSGQSAAVPKVPSFTSRTSGLCLCWFPHLGPCFSPLTVCRPPTAISDAGADGPAYGVGAAVSAAEGLGFWVNSLKSNGPGLSHPRLIDCSYFAAFRRHIRKS